MVLMNSQLETVAVNQPGILETGSSGLETSQD